MDHFPTFNQAIRYVRQPWFRQWSILGAIAGIELLPLLFGPFVMYLWSHKPSESVFSAWLNPWSYGQAAAIGFACVTLPGRWHLRVMLSLFGIYAVWLTYMLGIQMSGYAPNWASPTARPLASQLIWVFAGTAFYSSLVVSAGGVELRLESPPTGKELRTGQVSLGYITTCIFAACLTLVLVRLAFYAPLRWPDPQTFMTASPLQAVQLALWSLGASFAMAAAAASRHRWKWLVGVAVCMLALEYALHPWKPRRLYEAFFSARSEFAWQIPLIMLLHSFLLVTAWSRVGILLPRAARLDSLVRALASVR